MQRVPTIVSCVAWLIAGAAAAAPEGTATSRFVLSGEARVAARSDDGRFAVAAEVRRGEAKAATTTRFAVKSLAPDGTSCAAPVDALFANGFEG